MTSRMVVAEHEQTLPEPPRVCRRIKLSEDCQFRDRRRLRSRIHLFACQCIENAREGRFYERSAQLPMEHLDEH